MAVDSLAVAVWRCRFASDVCMPPGVPAAAGSQSGRLVHPAGCGVPSGRIVASAIRWQPGSSTVEAHVLFHINIM